VSVELRPLNRWTIARRDEYTIFDHPDQFAMLSFCEPLDFIPLLISHELFPSAVHRLLIRPRKQIHELRPMPHPPFPHGDYVKAIEPHNPRRVIAESVMKRCFVVLENLLDPELMDHPLSTLWHGHAWDRG